MRIISTGTHVTEFTQYRYYEVRLFKFRRGIFHLKSLAHANANAMLGEHVSLRAPRSVQREGRL